MLNVACSIKEISWDLNNSVTYLLKIIIFKHSILKTEYSIIFFIFLFLKISLRKTPKFLLWLFFFFLNCQSHQGTMIVLSPWRRNFSVFEMFLPIRYEEKIKIKTLGLSKIGCFWGGLLCSPCPPPHHYTFIKFHFERCL